jgi:hypothetical protein
MTDTTVVGHTPGPWRVERPFQEPGVYVSAPTTELVAKMFAPDRPEQMEANARLIAAAPEMLHVLRYLAAQSRGHSPDAMVRIRDVIAKATGQ